LTSTVAPLIAADVGDFRQDTPGRRLWGVANQRLNAHFRHLRADLPRRACLPDGVRPC